MSTLPEVTVTINENSLGLQDPAAGDSLAILGPATAGATSPLLYGRTGAVQADYTSGALIEAAATALEITGRPVVLVRTETTTAGAMGALDIDGVTGTAVPTATSGAEPIDDNEAEVTIVDGGTIETDGITYQWSHDGGRTLSPKTALGTGTVIATEGGVSFTLDPAAAEITAFIALVVEARTDTLAHLANVTAHDAADTSAAQVLLAASSAPTTAAQAWAVMNLCLAALAAHELDITVHNGPDDVNTVSHAAATNTSSGLGAAVEYKAKFNLHLAATRAAAPAGLKAATATVAAPVTVVVADMIAGGITALDAYPCRLIFTTAGVTPASAPPTVAISGTYLGVAQTETLALAQTAASVTSVKAWDGTGLTWTYAAADDIDATVAAGYGQAVHNSADATNVLTSTSPAPGTLAAGDTWSCRTSMPSSTDLELDTALAALQASPYVHKSILLLSPVTSTATANALKTRFETMKGALKFKKLFCSFRTPNIGESKAAYLAAFKAAFDAVNCYGISMSAGSVEYQSSATKPRIYRRPLSWLEAPQHVKLGPDVSVAYVNDGAGAMPLGATIKDANGNPKHHDETLDPGLDAARAVTLRSQPFYQGAFFTRARTLAQLGTDFMFLQNWAVMIEVLDVAVPKLVGQIQGKVAPDPDTGRILESAARGIELLVEHEIASKVTAKGWIVSARCVIDRTVNIFTTPKLPVQIKAVPFGTNDGFALSVMLDNPQFSNA